MRLQRVIPVAAQKTHFRPPKQSSCPARWNSQTNSKVPAMMQLENPNSMGGVLVCFLGANYRSPLQFQSVVSLVICDDLDGIHFPQYDNTNSVLSPLIIMRRIGKSKKRWASDIVHWVLYCLQWGIRECQGEIVDAGVFPVSQGSRNDRTTTWNQTIWKDRAWKDH